MEPVILYSGIVLLLIIIGSAYLLYERNAKQLREALQLKKDRLDAEVVALNPEEKHLLDYIQRQRLQGFSCEILEKTIVDTGWHPDEVKGILKLSSELESLGSK